MRETIREKKRDERAELVPQIGFGKAGKFPPLPGPMYRKRRGYRAWLVEAVTWNPQRPRRNTSGAFQESVGSHQRDGPGQTGTAQSSALIGREVLHHDPVVKSVNTLPGSQRGARFVAKGHSISLPSRRAPYQLTAHNGNPPREEDPAGRRKRFLQGGLKAHGRSISKRGRTLVNRSRTTKGRVQRKLFEQAVLSREIEKGEPTAGKDDRIETIEAAGSLEGPSGPGGQRPMNGSPTRYHRRGESRHWL